MKRGEIFVIKMILFLPYWTINYANFFHKKKYLKKNYLHYLYSSQNRDILNLHTKYYEKLRRYCS